MAQEKADRRPPIQITRQRFERAERGDQDKSCHGPLPSNVGCHSGADAKPDRYDPIRCQNLPHMIEDDGSVR